MKQVTYVLTKMLTERNAHNQVEYYLPVNGQFILLHERLGRRFSLTYTGIIFCIHCGHKTKKSYSGYCFLCFKKLAASDLCSVRPETCHFFAGTCREPEWAYHNCFIQHTVYLANSSDLKVGITRSHHQLNRWMDQGAHQAIVIGVTNSRFEAGKIEKALTHHVGDKTNWQKMLKETPRSIELSSKRSELLQFIPLDVYFKESQGIIENFIYPIKYYPDKINSLDFNSTSHIEGILLGIKGQYLIFDSGVLNIKKFSGYQVCMDVDVFEEI